MNDLYLHWNARINVISRKDIENLEINHILHSLSIAKVFSFTAGTGILDAGTGGGFPGIPLAVLFPNVNFCLVDSIAKKISVVKEIVKELGLQNVIALNERVENVRDKFDFITGRAITTLPGLCTLLKGKILKKEINALPNGLIYLKGGRFDDELRSIHAGYRIYNIADYFDEPYFETKKLIHIFRIS